MKSEIRNPKFETNSKFQIPNSELEKLLPDIKENILLKNYTTFKIGGPAKYFFVAKTKEDLIKVIKVANEFNLPFFILGGGSSLLVADKGFDGLIIKNEIRFIKISKTKKKINLPNIKLSYIQTKPVSKIKTLSFSDLDYRDEGEPILAQVGAGVSLGYLLHYTLKRDITGLQWFAGIPGTIGGALFFNAHGGTKYIGEYVYNATLVNKRGNLKKVDNAYFKFSYRNSILRKTKEIVIDATLRLYRGGDVNKARWVAKEWLSRKCIVQPRKNTPGSIFQNVHITSRQIKQFEKEKIGLTPEIINKRIIPAGWLIDKCGLRERKIGKAQVSQKHANFIVNLGGARAKDVLKLINLIKKKVKERYSIELEEEIQFLGF